MKPIKTIIKFLKKNRYFLAFLFLISWGLNLKTQLIDNANNNNFYWDAPFWIFFESVFIFLFARFLWKKKIVKNNILQFLLGLFAYLIISNVFQHFINLLCYIFNINNIGSDFIRTNASAIIDYVFFGSISLAYLYYNQIIKVQQEVTRLKESLSATKIAQLSQQLNPHFIFNNLNMIDQLIWESPEKASTFLNLFSEVYRFSLNNQHKTTIAFKDELAFSKKYFQLIKSKYEKAYNLTITQEVYNLQTKVPPYTLQTLIENAVKHNNGSAKKPIDIKIDIVKQNLIISNPIVPYDFIKKNSGIGLSNLTEQFKILFNQKIKIHTENQTFSVIIPLQHV